MRFSQHRGEIEGRRVDDNEIRRILRESDDVGRAPRSLGGVEDRRGRRRRRRPRARPPPQRGCRTRSATGTGSLSRWRRRRWTRSRLLATLDEADRATAAPFARWKARSRRAPRSPVRLSRSPLSRRGTTPTPFFQEVPAEGGVDLDPLLEGADLVELSRRTYDGIGLETRSVLERSDLFPRDGKCQHAFCIDIDRTGDVRVLANVVPGQQWMDTMLHELGHATFDAGLDPSLPWLLRDCHLVVTEGIAILMGRLASDAEWLERVLGVDADAVAAIAGALSAPLAPPRCSSSRAGCS